MIYTQIGRAVPIFLTVLLVTGLFLAFIWDDLGYYGARIKRGLKGKKNLWQKVSRIWAKSKKEKLDKEIFNSMIILKNLAIVQKETPLSADAIMEHLMANSNRLKTIYSEMLWVYRAGKPETAFGLFADKVGTATGSSFAALLSKLDKINPEELKEQITVMQEAMSEKRLTEGIRAAERNGALMMALSTACVLGLVLNFAFVVVFMDTLGMLSGIL